MHKPDAVAVPARNKNNCVLKGFFFVFFSRDNFLCTADTLTSLTSLLTPQTPPTLQFTRLFIYLHANTLKH